MNPSTALAGVLLDELLACGVRDVVLSPGSRNAPLSMAVHAAALAGRVRLHVRIDERTAGFLAVGLARGSGIPAAVVTTSGTAVANLHPSVLEAHHGQVPLVLLTADRPPALRDVGANQVIDQRSVFGSALRLFHEFGVPARAAGQNGPWRSMVCRAVAAARGGAGTPGPVQLNIPLTEPLLPEPDGVDDHWPEPLDGRDGPWTVIDPRPAGWVDRGIAAPAPGERVLYLAALGHPAGAALAAAGHPVIGEAGGATGSGALAAGLHLLGHKEFVQTQLPDRVVVLGRPTLYRQVSALLADQGVVVDVLGDPAAFADVAGRARTVSATLDPVGPPVGDEWTRRWRSADRAAGAAVERVLRDAGQGTSLRLAHELLAALAPQVNLVLGSSQPARDVGLASAARDGVRVIANRGVAGIDGTVSTAVGVALADPDRPTVALLGDLTLLHDATGLVIGPGEPRPDLTIVVSSNDGGAIFHALEPGESRHAHAFERVFGTPHGVSIELLAGATGAGFRRVSDPADLPGVLADPAPGITVVEVPTDRSRLRALQAEICDTVAAAVRDL